MSELSAAYQAAQEDLRKTYPSARLRPTLCGHPVLGPFFPGWTIEYTNADGPPWSIGFKDVTNEVERFVYRWEREQREQAVLSAVETIRTADAVTIEDIKDPLLRRLLFNVRAELGDIFGPTQTGLEFFTDPIPGEVDESP